MIVVAEGPTAAGKTTWAKRIAADRVVAENQGLTPPGGEEAAARYWLDANIRRWNSAVSTERETGVAVCDSDPLKLHYDYCLSRLGGGPTAAYLIGVGLCRGAVERRELGIADVIFCCIPSRAELVRHAEADLSRRRRNFDLHAELAGPLGEWYRALDELDPGRVLWQFPDGLSDPVNREHYDLDLFDSWMDSLASNFERP